MKPHTTIAIVLATVAGLSASIAAAKPSPVEAIAQLNREAMENYDLLDYEAAKKTLSNALALAKQARLGKHEVVAQTHIYLAIVTFSGFGDRDSAALQLLEAVEIDSSVEIPIAYRTRELDQLLTEARAEVTAQSAESTVPDVDCTLVRGIQHEPVHTAARGRAVVVTAYLGKEVAAHKVRLFFREAGVPSYREVPMSRGEQCAFVGQIPADAVSGDFLHYYVVALDKSSRVLAAKGSAGSPNIIDLAEVAADGGGGDDRAAALDDENPFVGRRELGDASVRDRLEVGGNAPRFFVAAAVGSGGGYYVNGLTESTRQGVGCCVAAAPFHVLPEIGWFVARQTAVSAAFRIGFPIGANIQGHSTGAPAGLVRVRHALSSHGAGLVINGAIGGGVVRNTVKLKAPHMGDPGMDTDTAAAGPLLVGAGAGYMTGAGRPVRLNLEVNALAGIPVVDSFQGVQPDFGVQVDFNVGVLFAF
jgi:hypothetical protein